MSVQVFLLGTLSGIDGFVVASDPGGAADERQFAGRSIWVSLLSEVLPLALLAELGLSRALVGSSGGGQFLVVLPDSSRDRAAEFLARARDGVRALSGGRLRLLWASTENLGEWSLVRRRLFAALTERAGTPLAGGLADMAVPGEPASEYFLELGTRLRDASSVGWSAGEPARLLWEGGERQWPLGAAPGAISLARHAALSEDGSRPAALAEIARRAEGVARWGVLRGDIDNFGLRLRRAQSVEEHIQLSVLARQFLAGEIEVLASLPEYWRKVSVLYAGGDDFAVCGAWDALLPFARELQRLFGRLVEEQMKDLPGPEGKTLSMAMAIAPSLRSPFAFVYEEAGRALEAAKSAGKDCFHGFGRTLDWKQWARSAELKNVMLRMVRDYRCSPAFLRELGGFYADRLASPGRESTDRPWRYHRRISLALGEPPLKPAAQREFEKQKNALIGELIGRGSAHARLRPSGRVAVDWARLTLNA